MRLAVAALIWVVLVGGLATYMAYRNQGAVTHSQMLVQARGAFAVEVTPTFDLEPDPFALQTNDSGTAPALLLKINGTEVAKRSHRIQRGIPLVFERVPSLTQGSNEVYLEANPPLEEANRALAVRVRVLRDGQPIVERSFWSDMGSKISATFDVKIEPERGTEERSHGH
jgi:hypothetical protein